MIEKGNARANFQKRDDILRAAKQLFLEKGYNQTSVREIVHEANTSMGNLYFHFPNKLSILKVISMGFIKVLREQTRTIRKKDFPPEIGFALDFRIGYITTLEDPRLSKLWLIVRNTPEIHQYSLENKRVRLQTFFGDRIKPEEMHFMTLALQGIADIFFEQKRHGNLRENAAVMSNAIIDYSLRILGYSHRKIRHVISEVERYVREKKIRVDGYFDF
jgi:AcrR family transcriptional regulator